jgi:hypothetical protein
LGCFTSHQTYITNPVNNFFRWETWTIQVMIVVYDYSQVIFVFPHKNDANSSLPSVVCRRAHTLFRLFKFVCVTNSFCVVFLFFFVLCTLYCVFVFLRLCCQFLWMSIFIAPSVFSNDHLTMIWCRLFKSFLKKLYKKTTVNWI